MVIVQITVSAVKKSGGYVMEGKNIRRCSWVDSASECYHDNEWGKPSHDDDYLFEMLLLESFQAGLSWVIILKKREGFRRAFDGFDYKKIAEYTDNDIERLVHNDDIIKSRGKIAAAVQNAKVFMEIQKEFGSFSDYLWSFVDGQPIRDASSGYVNRTPLSDKISKDLKKRGMKYMGSTTTLAYLLAVGIYNAHEPYCFLSPECTDKY